MNTDAQNRYFQELTLNLQHEGFTVKPKTEEWGMRPERVAKSRLAAV